MSSCIAFISLCLGVLLSFSAKSSFLPNSFEADFTQQFKSAVTGKVNESKGVLRYLTPGHFYFSIESPEDQKLIYVKNEQKTWHFVPSFVPGEANQLKIQKKANLFLADFFDTLRNDLQNNPYFKVVHGKRGVELIFSSMSEDNLKIKKALLIFNEKKENTFKELRQMHITKSDGQILDLNFDKIKNIDSLQSSTFSFTPPANTKVIEE